MISSSLIASLLLMAACQAAATTVPPSSGLHVVIEREFNFLASTRTTRSEQWLAGDRTYGKTGDIVSITRKDLGVRWIIDSAKKTYTERPLSGSTADRPAAQKPAVSSGETKPVEDLRTAGFNYEPAYDWTVTETGQTSTINGRLCTKVVAAGEADYAETNLVLWYCPRSEADVPGDPNVPFLNMIRDDSIRAFLDSQQTKRGNPILMSYEETTEPAISPVMITRIRIQTLESAPVPAGLFDIPAGVQKAARPQ